MKAKKRANELNIGSKMSLKSPNRGITYKQKELC